MSGLNPSGLGRARRFSSLDTAQGPSKIIHASGYGGANGGEQIQNAINDAPANATIVVGPNGPDDVSASSGSLSAKADAAWEVVDDYIYLDSNITLELHNAYIFASDELNQGLFRYRDETGTDNVAIEGLGDAIIDGNATNQDRTSKDRKWICLEFIDGNNLTVDEITIRNPAAWGIKTRAVDDVTAYFHCDYDGSKGNQDGIHVLGPCQDINIKKTGICHDDDIALDARSASSSDDFQTSDSGAINFVHVESGTSITRQAKILPGSGVPIQNVDINAIYTGEQNVTGMYITDESDGTPNPIDAANISISGIGESDLDQVVSIECPCTNIDIDVIADRARLLQMNHANINNVTVSGKKWGRAIAEAVRLDANANVDGLTVDGLTLAQKTNAPDGITCDASASLSNLFVAGLHAIDAETVFDLEAATTGKIESCEVGSATTIYNEIGDVSLSSDLPPIDVTQASDIQGSEAYNDGTTGTEGPAYNDGTGWVSLVDGGSI